MVLKMILYHVSFLVTRFFSAEDLVFFSETFNKLQNNYTRHCLHPQVSHKNATEVSHRCPSAYIYIFILREHYT